MEGLPALKKGIQPRRNNKWMKWEKPEMNYLNGISTGISLKNPGLISNIHN